MAANNNVQPNYQIMLHESLRPLRRQFSEKEIMAIESPEYTSLKDILPPPPSKSSFLHSKRQYLLNCSPDISTENPLLNQALIAYLHTGMQRLEDFGLVKEESFFEKLKNKCFNVNQCGCIRWLNEVVLNRLKAAFSNTRQDQSADDANDQDREKNLTQWCEGFLGP